MHVLNDKAAIMQSYNVVKLRTENNHIRLIRICVIKRKSAVVLAYIAELL